MFSKNSRYSIVPDTVASDLQGRMLAAKELRSLPHVTGNFHHIIKDGDRLDQLSYKYYGQPLQWWNICDANPQFLSPLEMLGQEVIAKALFPITVTGGGNPPWDALLRELRGLLGVEDVQVVEDVEIVSDDRVVSGKNITVFVDHYIRQVCVTYNQLNVTLEKLATQIVSAGFTPEDPVKLGQLGQEIIIPPRAG